MLLMHRIVEGKASTKDSSSENDDHMSHSLETDGGGNNVRHNHRRHLNPGKGSRKPEDTKASGKGKGSRAFKEVCIETGYSFRVEGSKAPLTGPTAASTKCPVEDLEDACTAYIRALLTVPTPVPPPVPPVEESEDYLQCLENERFVLQNWFFNREVPGTVQFVKTPSKDGNGSVKGTVSGTDRFSKVELEYVNFDFQDEPIGDLTRIAFDYYIQSCPTNCQTCNPSSGDPAVCPSTSFSCLNQIYVNIYTRLPANRNYYDCRYDYVLGSDLATELSFSQPGTWHSISFNPLTTPNNGYDQENKRGSCPANLAAALSNGYVLATKLFVPNFPTVIVPEECDFPLVLKLNIGDTECTDVGMVTLVDNFLIEFPYKDGSGAHIYDMVA